VSSRKLLVIANLEHASPRIPELLTGLKGLGWSCTVISPPMSESQIRMQGIRDVFFKEVDLLEAPYRGDIFSRIRPYFYKLGFKKSESLVAQVSHSTSGKKSLFSQYLLLGFSIFRYFFAFPDTERTWKQSALNTARAAFKEKSYDLILSSSPFPTSHVVAHLLAKELHVPWIADFRDPWNGNHFHQYLPPRCWIELVYERYIISEATGIIAAAPSYADIVSRIHAGRSVEVILNGFNQNRWNEKSESSSNFFEIAYTGTIYDGKQNPLVFLRGLKLALDTGEMNLGEVRVSFFGKRSPTLDQAIHETGLQHVVKYLGLVDRGEAQRIQSTASVLLVLNWEDRSTPVYPSKLFEYFGARKMILASGGYRGDDVDQIIRETESGIFAVSETEVKEAVLGLYKAFRDKNINLSTGSLQKMGAYSYEANQTKLVKIFESLI